jgi:hypothetical protein
MAKCVFQHARFASGSFHYIPTLRFGVFVSWW